MKRQITAPKARNTGACNASARSPIQRAHSSSISIAACILLSACPSTSVHRSATPTPEGEWRVGGGASLGAMSDREQQSLFPTADVELSARRGMSENLDMGGKLFTAGVEFNATWRVRQDRWSLALAPSLSGLRVSESGALPASIHAFAQLAGVASRQLNQRWTLSTGPTTGAGLYWPETGGSAQGAWLGAFVNGEARLGATWRITPELSMYRVLAGQVPVRGAAMRMGFGLSRDL